LESIDVPVFDQFPKASFNDQAFPVSSIEVIGGLRDHVHEYSHSDGGDPEKLGRRLYTYSFTALFHATFPKYPLLYPLTLNNLIPLFDSGQTKALVIPTIGTVQAYCTSWRRKATGAARSGETLELEFREDASNAFLLPSLLNLSFTSLAVLGRRLNAAEIAAISANASLLPQMGIFDRIQNAINDFLAIGDTAGAYAMVAQAKCQSIQDLCAQADRLAAMKDPANFALFDALHATWDAAAQTGQNLLSKTNPLRPFTVPAAMSVSAISQTIYGDTSHIVELLSLNPIEDAFNVRAGVKLNYYPAS
jgi:prophage DNA circulation protein